MHKIGTLVNLQGKKQMKDNYFLDTNALIYLISTEDFEKHLLIKKFILKTNNNCFISIQNIKEFANVSLKKSNKSIEKIQSTIDVLLNKFYILNEANNNIIHALQIAKRKNFYDALLVATMKRNGINKIITKNEKDFIDFKEIKVINPFSKIKLSK
jgi:predicted nucleic acid-binding protein